MAEIPLDEIPLSEDGIPILRLSAQAPSSSPAADNGSWWDGVLDWAQTVTWQDAGHTALDIGGLFPGLGEGADAANAVWYASEGNYLDAAFSTVSMIPLVGDAIGKGGKYALKVGGKLASDVLKAISKHGGIDALLKGIDELGGTLGLPKDALKKMKDALKEWYDKLVAKVKGEKAPAPGDGPGGVLVTKGGEGAAARVGERRISDDLYKELRAKTPSPEIRDMVNDGKVGPMSDEAIPGKIVEGRLEADHIVPVDTITRMENFEKLTKDQQLAVLNNPRNFVGLSRSANASKGAKSFEDWTVYKKENIPIDPGFRERMIERERELSSELQNQIDSYFDD